MANVPEQPDSLSTEETSRGLAPAVDEGITNTVTDTATAVSTITTPVEATEPPETFEVRQLREDMRTRANEGNNWFNFGSEVAMNAFLDKLSPQMQAEFMTFVRALEGRRTEVCVPVIVQAPDGASVYFTESIFAITPDINLETARALVGHWGHGISSPDIDQWELLYQLGLVGKRDHAELKDHVAEILIQPSEGDYFGDEDVTNYQVVFIGTYENPEVMRVIDMGKTVLRSDSCRGVRAFKVVSRV